MDDIKSYIAQLEATAMRLTASYSGAIEIIKSAPGISQFSALAIFSEIGADMSTFHSAKHLCSWAGLAPSNDQSAGKKKSVRISRAGVYIKPLLVQCANAAIKDKKFPHYRTRYEAIKHRRGHKRAIIAIARMLLTAIYHMLSTGELFNPALYEKSQCKPGFVASSEQHAVKLLQRLGYSVVKIPEFA
ncbi:MAG: transposase [Carboxydocellales bacterium]